MAERTRSSKSAAPKSAAPKSAASKSARGTPSKAPSISQVARQAVQELQQLVGCPAEGVSGVRRTDEGWVVTVEVLEISRVPQTTDVLASYEVAADEGGEVTGYHRVRRYLRAQVED